MHSLIRSLAERNAEYRSLELRHNHLELQYSALQHQVITLKDRLVRVEFDCAVAEENVLLLEV